MMTTTLPCRGGGGGGGAHAVRHGDAHHRARERREVGGCGLRIACSHRSIFYSCEWTFFPKQNFFFFFQESETTGKRELVTGALLPQGVSGGG